MNKTEEYLQLDGHGQIENVDFPNEGDTRQLWMAHPNFTFKGKLKKVSGPLVYIKCDNNEEFIFFQDFARQYWTLANARADQLEGPYQLKATIENGGGKTKTKSKRKGRRQRKSRRHRKLFILY
jgi:hypothetical protein